MRRIIICLAIFAISCIERKTITPPATPAPIDLKADLRFPPVPEEDRESGENDNAYLTALGHPTSEETSKFKERVIACVAPLAKKYTIPASAIIAMALNESGAGFTRTGVFANNLFGQKNWGCKWQSRYATGCYQLRGQPDEAWDGSTRAIETTRHGELIFDEKPRVDNRYFEYDSFEDSIKALIEEWIIESKYHAGYDKVVKNYVKNLPAFGKRKAAGRFLCDLAAAGYNQNGCDYYEKTLGEIIDRYNLTQFD